MKWLTAHAAVPHAVTGAAVLVLTALGAPAEIAAVLQAVVTALFGS